MCSLPRLGGPRHCSITYNFGAGVQCAGASKTSLRSSNALSWSQWALGIVLVEARRSEPIGDDNISFHADCVEDLIAAFHEALKNIWTRARRLGSRPKRSYSGKIVLRVHESTHARAAKAAELVGNSLNEFGEEALQEAATGFLAC